MHGELDAVAELAGAIRSGERPQPARIVWVSRGPENETTRMPDVLDGGPVVLRRRREADVPKLVRAIELSLPELAQWFGWAQQEPNVVEQRRRTADGERAFDDGTDYEFLLIEDDDVVGGLRLNPSAAPDAAGIGYWVRSDRTGRGYATSATRAATTAAFEHLSHVERVYILMDQANLASVAVPTKLGFLLDREEDRPIEAPGHTGRGFIWVMTRDRWSPQS